MIDLLERITDETENVSLGRAVITRLHHMIRVAVSLYKAWLIAVFQEERTR